jgi:hypothetical protein
VTHLTDQLWKPSPKPNVVDETRAERVDNLTRYVRVASSKNLNETGIAASSQKSK